jgi:uncharacterized protein (DUF1330 family)
MSAYCLFDNLEVLDPNALAEYARLVAPVVAAHGGRYVALGTPAAVLEGASPLTYPVMIEFPTLEAAKGWYDSAEYAPLKAMRHAATRSSGVLLGLTPTT